jgi:hypothetical protein
MVRRATLAAFVTGLLILAFATASQTSGPIKLARHPDYHAGKIAFSYLGDIWTANEDGSAPQRLTDNRGHEVYPRFSPDGRWIAFDGSTIRTPASGVWTVTSQNMENYGVPPDVFVDNTPGDFLKGRDAQIEKAVEVLKAELAAKKPTTAQP